MRDSFVQYINGGGSITPSEGATSGTPTVRPGSSQAMVYDFHFPFANGFYESASGVTGIYYTGKLNFSYPSHGIDFDTKNPELELNGANSRAIFRMEGRGSTKYDNKRAVVVTLEPDKAESKTVSGDGKTITYTKIPGKVPEGAADSIFAGFYFPGDEFGWFSLTFTVA